MAVAAVEIELVLLAGVAVVETEAIADTTSGKMVVEVGMAEGVAVEIAGELTSWVNSGLPQGSAILTSGCDCSFS